MLPISISRPVTSTSPLRTLTNRSRWSKKSDSLKNEPLNAKLNGIAEKPALPTGTEPGAGAREPSVVTPRSRREPPSP